MESRCQRDADCESLNAVNQIKMILPQGFDGRQIGGVHTRRKVAYATIPASQYGFSHEIALNGSGGAAIPARNEQIHTRSGKTELFGIPGKLGPAGQSGYFEIIPPVDPMCAFPHQQVSNALRRESLHTV
ncbi:MAG TPA: hypothetical protein VHA14_12525 [Bryobacteraceae bacterium]|nr:hypothetical protein [Bryobacteraceae bacterium]